MSAGSSSTFFCSLFKCVNAFQCCVVVAIAAIATATTTADAGADADAAIVVGVFCVTYSLHMVQRKT